MNPVRARSVCWKVDKYFMRVCCGTAQSRLGAPGVEAPEPVALDTGKETAEIAQWVFKIFNFDYVNSKHW